MIKTIDFNALAAGTAVADAYAAQGVHISATGGAGQARVIDTAAATGQDADLASAKLGGALIIAAPDDPEDETGSDAAGSLFFDFEGPVRIKSLTFKDIEAVPGSATRLIFYDADGEVMENHWVDPTEDGGERRVELSVPGTARVEVVLPKGGAVDNLVFEDKNPHPVNHDPNAKDDTAELDEDGSIVLQVLDNDLDVDGDPLTLTAANSEQGEVIINDDGTVTFTPDPDFSGDAQVSYTIEDGHGGTDDGLVALTVNPINDAPVAQDDMASTPYGEAVVIDLLANDTEVDDAPESLGITDLTSEGGSVTDNGDGTVTFTPDDGFTGEAVITYAVVDPDGAKDTGEAVVAVGDGNAPPVAEEDSIETDEDTAVVIDVLANDSDPDGDPLTLIEASSPDGGVTLQDGQVLFTPAAHFHGETTVSYSISDGKGGTASSTVKLDVLPVNDAPSAEEDSAETPYETPILGHPVLTNDTDPDAEDTLTLTTAHSEEGTVEINPDNTVNFTPNPGFSGAATVLYTVSDRPADDPEAATDQGMLTIMVAPPSASDGFVDGGEGSELIDENYVGDPDGDLVDGGDALLYGSGPDDDFIRAGAGDDTILAGAGDDVIEGGAGDDLITDGAGRETVTGGAGNDVIDTSREGVAAPDLGYPVDVSDDLTFAPDTDPEDDRDAVDGGAGDDVIRTGDDRDTITGGAGADLIDGGIDDDVISGDSEADLIIGGEGNDNIFGGSGDDTIYAGLDPALGLDVLSIPDDTDNETPYAPDRNPFNGRDTVSGGDGNDVIYGADDDDLLLGGAGDDLLDGQIDDDHLSGGTGADTLFGGQGQDSLFGNEDSDILDGGSGDDLLDGGGDDDMLAGGDGDDLLLGAMGDDILIGGAGNDTMSGGEGMDLFSGVTVGDVIDGGSGPVDFDTLDLRGSTVEGGRFEINYLTEDQQSGEVQYFDADGMATGSLRFDEIEAVVPCFTPGTLIATPQGQRRVETLQVGDSVITRDNGLQPIRWVGQRRLSGAELARDTDLRPVLIRQGALGKGMPERDLLVSPNHRILIVSDQSAFYFEDREVLVAAKHLTCRAGIDTVEASDLTYVHLMFDHHEVILSDGAWSESFQPGDNSLAGVEQEQRNEIFRLFPELATQEGVMAYGAARRSLRKHEAQLL